MDGVKSILAGVGHPGFGDRVAEDRGEPGVPTLVVLVVWAQLSVTTGLMEYDLGDFLGCLASKPTTGGSKDRVSKLISSFNNTIFSA